MTQPHEHGEHGTIRVRVTSIDARADHPFQVRGTVRDVHEWGYGKVVKDTGAVPFDATWMEYGGERVDDARSLSSFSLPEEKNRGKDIDLTLGLAWTSQGG